MDHLAAHRPARRGGPVGVGDGEAPGAEGLVGHDPYRALGHPARDPHGDPIPPKRGRHRDVRGEPLAAVAPGRLARVERVSDHDPAVLRHLADDGAVAGAWWAG